MRIKRYVETRLAKEWGRHKVGALVVKASKIMHKIIGECWIPLPNPVFAYLDTAEKMLEGAKEMEKALIRNAKEGVNKKTGIKSWHFSPQDFDEYFQVATVVIITSFLVLESYCNQAIPEDFFIKKKRWNFPFFSIVTIPKRKIERMFSTEKKLNEVLPIIFKKRHIKGTALWSKFSKLLKLRNDLVHLKSPIRDNENGTYGKNYELLCEDVVNADLEQIVKTPREIISYFDEHYFDDPHENVRTRL